MTTLFIDYDFMNKRNGASNRSEFLLKTLQKKSRVDVLVLDPVERSYNSMKRKFDIEKVFYAKTKNRKKYFTPSNLTSFSDKTIEAILKIVEREKYETIVVRFYVHDRLMSIIRAFHPNITIIVDVDLLFSKFCMNIFMQNPTLENRYYLIEHVKLKKYEKAIFKKDYTFLFSNYEEMESVRSSDHFHWITNPIFKNNSDVDNIEEDYILFYGNLNSSVMKKSFEQFLENIYPNIVNSLEQLGVKVHIVGRGNVEFYQELISKSKARHIEVLGKVSDIKKFIKSAQLVVFPIKAFGGTLTRLMETIECKVPIVATEKVVEPLGLSRYIPCSDDNIEFSRLINTSLISLEKSKSLAENCFKFSFERFGEPVVANKITSILNESNISIGVSA